mmetsp:Transcript_37409/g.93961  ORF Transcript_37409/g.93961 Transcript_37409/m.93961 type:complete len:461 (-) Transcript_37409:1489-2871(-)
MPPVCAWTRDGTGRRRRCPGSPPGWRPGTRRSAPRWFWAPPPPHRPAGRTPACSCRCLARRRTPRSAASRDPGPGAGHADEGAGRARARGCRAPDLRECWRLPRRSRTWRSGSSSPPSPAAAASRAQSAPARRRYSGADPPRTPPSAGIPRPALRQRTRVCQSRPAAAQWRGPAPPAFPRARPGPQRLPSPALRPRPPPPLQHRPLPSPPPRPLRQPAPPSQGRLPPPPAPSSPPAASASSGRAPVRAHRGRWWRSCDAAWRCTQTCTPPRSGAGPAQSQAPRRGPPRARSLPAGAPRHTPRAPRTSSAGRRAAAPVGAPIGRPCGVTLARWRTARRAGWRTRPPTRSAPVSGVRAGAGATSGRRGRRASATWRCSRPGPGFGLPSRPRRPARRAAPRARPPVRGLCGRGRSAAWRPTCKPARSAIRPCGAGPGSGASRSPPRWARTADWWRRPRSGIAA